ncbi:MAG: hypothetical protein C5B52_01905 [Bacteroidetes bacterium]|nr:MAG: hypothetical protein C5B52_01905 [Bacteroidota bacterium]
MKKINYKIANYLKRNLMSAWMLGLSLILSLSIATSHANEDPANRSRWHQQSVERTQADINTIFYALNPLCVSHKIVAARIENLAIKSDNENLANVAFWVSSNWTMTLPAAIKESDEIAIEEFEFQAALYNLIPTSTIADKADEMTNVDFMSADNLKLMNVSSGEISNADAQMTDLFVAAN